MECSSLAMVLMVLGAVIVIALASIPRPPDRRRTASASASDFEDERLDIARRPRPMRSRREKSVRKLDLNMHVPRRTVRPQRNIIGWPRSGNNARQQS